MSQNNSSHIESHPERCGGKPCIRGTRIRVWDVYVLHEREGKTADEIIGDFPELSLADVYAALAYYYDHQKVIDAQMKAADEFVDSLKATLGPGPLATKLAGATSRAPISS